MKVEIFTLCDAATSHGGKLNILGSFDMIIIKQTPIVYPSCSVAIKLRIEKIEEGNKKLRISFVDADGKYILTGLYTSYVYKPVFFISHLPPPILLITSIKIKLGGKSEMSYPFFFVLTSIICSFIIQFHAFLLA